MTHNHQHSAESEIPIPVRLAGHQGILLQLGLKQNKKNSSPPSLLLYHCIQTIGASLRYLKQLIAR